MVVKFFDNIGLIYLLKDSEYIFSLSQLSVVDLISLKNKTLEIGKQYLLVIEVKDHKIDRISNETLELVKPNIIFDKLQIGRGHGLIYDLIVYDTLLEGEKINEITKSLNKIHKIKS